MDASRRLFVTLLGIVLAADGACSRKQKDSAAPETRVPLLVHNSSFFDVAIYALPAGATTRVRLGNVTGFSSATLSVSPVARRGGGSLVLQLHAIGSNQRWVTPEIFLYEGVVACLEIHADLSGDLSRSSFYTAVAPDSEPPPEAERRRDACGRMSAPGLERLLDVESADAAAMGSRWRWWATPRTTAAARTDHALTRGSPR